MDNSITGEFAARSFSGYWKIHHRDYPQEYFGDFLYDPIKGLHELTLYGICISPNIGVCPIPVITGSATIGKKVTIFDLVVKGATSGTGDTISQKTIFTFISCCIGDVFFTTKDSVRLRKYSFRCSNLEVWANYHPFYFKFSKRRKRNLGKIDHPMPLLIYEDDVVRIKLETIIIQGMHQFSMNLSYHHKITIEAKGNRKLPYWGQKNCFCYYEKAICCFCGLIIGKHAVSFNHIGIIEKKRKTIPTDVFPELVKRRFFLYPNIEFFNARKIEENWLERIDCSQVLLKREKMDDETLRKATQCFFAKFSQFDFVLDDWMAMRNRSSYTNHSLPEMLYNIEGLHRALYPECDSNPGYSDTINAIHEISPFDDYNALIKSQKNGLYFRQRLQDILLIKVVPVYSFLTILQKKMIVDYLVDVRNNAAHRNQEADFSFQKMVACIFLCEQVIAIMIFLKIGLPIDTIYNNLKNTQEYDYLKEKLPIIFNGK